MTMRRKFKSDAFEAIHSAVEGARRHGGQADPALLRRSVPVPADDLRRQEDQGSRRPSGLALKLLSVVEKHGLQVLQ